MSCDCLKKANETIASANARLVNPTEWGPKGMKRLDCVVLSIEKIDKKSRTPLPTFVATFCPFCGVKYDDGKEGG